MHEPLASGGKPHGGLLRATLVWTMFGVGLLVLAPLGAPALVAMTPLAPLIWSWLDDRVAPHPPTAPIAALLVTGLYLLINAGWSRSPASAYSAVFAFFLFVGAVYLARDGLQNTRVPALRSMAAGFHTGIAVAACAVLFEAVTQQWLRRQLMAFVPSLQPDGVHMLTNAQGQVEMLQPYLLNRSIAVLTLLMWPLALAVRQLAPPERRSLYWLALVPLLGAAFASHHATSKIAMIGSTVVFIAIICAPDIAKRAVAFLWIFAWLLVVPIAALAYRGQLYLADWLPFSGQHRIVIWGLTAQEIARAPLLGAGISTGRAIGELSAHDVEFIPGTRIPMGLAVHSHNVYLQTWYEAGAIGVALLLICGLLILRSIGRAPAGCQPFLYASFASCALMGSSSFSLWQPWFMALLGVVAAFAVLGVELAKRASFSESIGLANR